MSHVARGFAGSFENRHRCWRSVHLAGSRGSRVISEEEARSTGRKINVAKLPLARNPRAKMQSVEDGFVKIISSRSGIVIGGVMVGPHASDLIFPPHLGCALPDDG